MYYHLHSVDCKLKRGKKGWPNMHLLSHMLGHVCLQTAQLCSFSLIMRFLLAPVRAPGYQELRYFIWELRLPVQTTTSCGHVSIMPWRLRAPPCTVLIGPRGVGRKQKCLQAKNPLPREPGAINFSKCMALLRTCTSGMPYNPSPLQPPPHNDNFLEHFNDLPL